MKRILVIKNRAFGDSIIGLGALQYIRDKFPQAHLTYGVPAWVAPLYGNVKIAADEVLPFSLSGIGDWLRMYKKTRGYDLIIELQQSGRSGKFFKLTYGNKYFFHNHNKTESNFILDQGIRKPIIQRDLDGCFSVLRKLNGESAVPEYLNYTPKIELESIAKKRIVLGLVATRPTKMWPLNYYKKLVDLLEQEGIEFVIPLSNSRDDQILEKKIEALKIKATIIKKTLADLPSEISGSLAYVGNDTGLKHLSVALGVKTFTFFGPEEPLEWHPYDSSIHPYYFVNELDCRTVVAHYCGLFSCDSMICMRRLEVEKVAKDIQNSLI